MNKISQKKTIIDGSEQNFTTFNKKEYKYVVHFVH